MPLPSGDSVISGRARACLLTFLLARRLAGWLACLPACLPQLYRTHPWPCVSASRRLNSLNHHRCCCPCCRSRRRHHPFKVNGPAGYNDRIQLFYVSYIYKARLQSIFNIASKKPALVLFFFYSLPRTSAGPPVDPPFL